MNRLLSQGDKIPHRAVEKFLKPIGFDKLSSGEFGLISFSLFIKKMVNILFQKLPVLTPLLIFMAALKTFFRHYGEQCSSWRSVREM
jgi:hypothetical protein